MPGLSVELPQRIVTSPLTMVLHGAMPPIQRSSVPPLNVSGAPALPKAPPPQPEAPSIATRSVPASRVVPLCAFVLFSVRIPAPRFTRRNVPPALCNTIRPVLDNPSRPPSTVLPDPSTTRVASPLNARITPFGCEEPIESSPDPLFSTVFVPLRRFTWNGPAPRPASMVCSVVTPGLTCTSVPAALGFQTEKPTANAGMPSSKCIACHGNRPLCRIGLTE